MSKLKSLNKMFAILLVFTFLAGIAAPGMPVAYAKDEAKDNAKLDIRKLLSDIEDKNTKEAVERLAAFGIINGKEDGKYHPGDKVTREEFAKILVTSLNMESAAKAGLGFAHFSDVGADRWSAGYIGIAAGHGLIKGYPDGTFKPANEVSYAEAVTMLVRALGYKDEFLSGTWPANYLAKGAEKEITKKVKFGNALGFSDRGDVAIMVNNTLDAKVIEVETYEGALIKYKESEKLLLEDKLNIEKLEDARVIANKRIDDGLKEDEVRLDVPYEKKSKDSKEKDYDFIDYVNPEIYLGEEVNAYLNDDDEVIYLEKTDADKVYFDYVKKAIVDKDGKYIKALDLAKADDDFEFDEDAMIYVLDSDKYKAVKLSDEEISLSDYKFDDFAGHVGKFVIKNRKIIYAEIMEMGEAAPWMVVMENKSDMLKGVCADDDEFEFDLTKDGNYDGVIVLDIEGFEIKVGDIEKGDLIYAQKQSYDGDDYAVVRVVKDNALKGKLDRVQENKVKVGGEERNVTHYTDAEGNKVFDAYYSIDDGEEIKVFGTDNSEFIDDMDDADDEDIIAYTDAVGRIAYFVTEAEATSGYRYGVVTRTYADNDRLKVFTITEKGEDDEFVYNVEEDKNVKNARLLDEYGRKYSEKEYNEGKDKYMKIKEGSVIKFKFNKDGEIAEDKLYVMDPANLWKMEAGGKNDFGSDYLPKAKLIDTKNDLEGNFGGAGINFDTKGDYYSFSVDDNVAIIDAEKYVFDTKGDKDKQATIADKYIADISDEDFAKGNWKELSKSNGADLFFYVFADDDKKVNAKAVVFIGNASGSAANDEIGIYVTKVWYKGGDTNIDYVEYGESKIQSRVVDKGDSKVKKEHPYIAKVKSNGKIDIVEPNSKTGLTSDDFSIITGIVESRKSDSITLDKAVRQGDNQTFKNKMYNISSKTVVYEEDKSKNTSNLVKGDVVLMVVEKGTNARVIERLIGNERSKALEAIDKGIVDPVGPGDEDEDKIEVIEKSKDEIEVVVKGYKDAYYVGIYTRDGKLLSETRLVDGKASYKNEDGVPVFVKVVVYDKAGKVLAEENLARKIAVDEVKLTTKSATLLVGDYVYDNKDTIELKVEVLPKNATNKNVKWESKDEKIAIVDKNGKVTAVAEGKTTITVKSLDNEKLTDTCEITVEKPDKVDVTGIELNRGDISAVIGDSYKLKATVRPQEAYNKKVSWKSSDSKVATVDRDGNVEAVGKGTATITVTSDDKNNVSTSITITVK